MSKVIVITGASSGIGKAAAFEFLQKGFKVYACARRVEHMTDIVEFGASIHPVDITKPEQVEDFVQTVIKEEGKIDVLINNAGFGLYGAVEDITLDQARYQYEVNIFGLAHITKCVLPYMREQKSGRIINISSVEGKYIHHLVLGTTPRNMHWKAGLTVCDWNSNNSALKLC